jgi:alpha-tubulin suppressor-like RCC1 family protein
VVSDATCNFAATGDLQSTNPQLGAFGDNGGTTLGGHQPADASPAVDSIPHGAVGCGTTVAADQHVTTRPQRATCDAGAIEVPVDYIDVVSGDSHSCGLREDWTVWCWGFNFYGQLGDGTQNSSETPVQVVGLNTVTTVTAGRFHTCATQSGGVVRCWGYNNAGQLGDGTTTDSPVPVTVTGLVGAGSIAAGESHTCARVGDETAGYGVRCWGLNSSGQLGDGTTQDRLAPVAVIGLPSVHAVVAGLKHTCVEGVAGGVSCWGENSDGQLGNGSTISSATPVPVFDPGLVDEVAAGGRSSCAVMSADLTVQCWGSNSLGQLGNGTSGSIATTPVPVTGLVVDAQLAASGRTLAVGLEHACARRADLSLACWGGNGHGQLGNGTLAASAVPVAVIGVTGADPRGPIAAGWWHTGVIEAGRPRFWGRNPDGQLGDATTTSRSRPVAVRLR